jgi:hypothetical protein
MSRVRRGGFVVVWWKGDHEPRHVHVFRDDRLILKWDLDRWQSIQGEAPARIRWLLMELRREGRL